MATPLQKMQEPVVNMRISPLQSQVLAQLAAQRLQNPATTAGLPGAPSSTPTEATFSSAFKNALQSVSNAQNQVNQMQNEVQAGNPAVSLEETMVAMQKAQIGFQAALNVRNRMVQAYSDIMNMSV
jgi:flagellar hook-basal body complex protein FliE